MFGPDWKDGEVLETGHGGVVSWSTESVEWDCSLPVWRRQREGGRGGKKGCCLWVNAMGHLAQTQQLD